MSRFKHDGGLMLLSEAIGLDTSMYELRESYESLIEVVSKQRFKSEAVEMMENLGDDPYIQAAIAILLVDLANGEYDDRLRS